MRGHFRHGLESCPHCRHLCQLAHWTHASKRPSKSFAPILALFCCRFLLKTWNSSRVKGKKTKPGPTETLISKLRKTKWTWMWLQHIATRLPPPYMGIRTEGPSSRLLILCHLSAESAEFAQFLPCPNFTAAKSMLWVLRLNLTNE